MSEPVIIWTEYMQYRAEFRGFKIETIESILRSSLERYIDVRTGRYVVVGSHNETLVMIPYERSEKTITPVTVHATSRQQVQFRVKTGRLEYE